jgi:hypothetical protein
VDASDAADELTTNQKLLADGFVQRARILQLERAEAESRSKVAEGRGKLAASRERSAEIRASMARVRNQYQREAARAAGASGAFPGPGGSADRPITG